MSRPDHFDADHIKREARGREVEILEIVAGIPASHLDGMPHPCPACGGKDRFRLVDPEAGAVYCNQCLDTGNGDFLAAVRHFRKVSFDEACRLCAKHLGMTKPDQKGERTNPDTPASSPLAGMTEHYANLKDIPLESFKAFYAFDERRMWTKKFNYGETSKVSRVPMFDETGKVCSYTDFGDFGQLLKGMNAEKKPESYPEAYARLSRVMSPDSLKWMRGVERPAGLYIPDNLRKATPQNWSEIVLTEGVKDAAALHDMGYPAIGIPGKILPAKFAKLFRGSVTIVPDNDNGGIDGAWKTASRLKHAKSIRFAQLPGEVAESEGDGVREVRSSQGDEAIREAIANAREVTPEEIETELKAAKAKSKQEGIRLPPSVTNYKLEMQDGNPVKIPLPMREIHEQIEDVAKDRGPYRVDNVLFVDEGSEISWIKKPSALFGFIGSIAGSPPEISRAGGFHTQDEIFSELQRTAKAFSDIETIPHHPRLDGTYYACGDVPSGDGETLQKLLDRFNPATPIDRDLILALIVSPGWGGSGNRPAFAITSDDGRGSGKTTLAKIVGRIWRGRIEVGPGEPIEKIKERLLSPDALLKRVVNIDNVKTMKFSNSGLEAIVTADIINGRRMYYGDASRPNTLTWITTLNGVSFATDWAQRSIIIKIQKPIYSGNWQDDTEAFIDENRDALIADCLGFLREPAGFQFQRFTRWGNWEKDVLARLPEPNEAQKVIAERQTESNVEDEESAELENQIREKMTEGGYQPDEDVVFISSKVMCEIQQSVTGEKIGTTKSTQMLKQRINEGGLPNLRYSRTGQKRGFVWRGNDSDPDTEANPDLETRIEEKRKKSRYGF